MGKEKLYGGKIIRASSAYVIIGIVQACIIIACIGVAVGSCYLDSENNNQIKIEGEVLNGEM